MPSDSERGFLGELPSKNIDAEKGATSRAEAEVAERLALLERTAIEEKAREQAAAERAAAKGLGVDREKLFAEKVEPGKPAEPIPTHTLLGNPPVPGSPMAEALASVAEGAGQARFPGGGQLEPNRSVQAVPSIGRVVHYRSYGTPKGEYQSKPIAAVITEVEYYDAKQLTELLGRSEHDRVPTGRVGLFIMNPTGIFFRSLNEGGCTQGDGPGQWNWPPRV